ncbi:MAG: lipopolysaccharide biosynthesis protein [Planctomycetales bacterium]|nr:lipopolysaccharide biosynthesis protein [Planctomycetales bacterium]
MKPLRELLQHSSVYAVGQILNRLASVLLLPLYTHCLSTADYGVTAILDLTAVILSLMIGGGMVSAVTRFHFDGDTSAHRDRLWWTGLTYLAMTSCVVLLPMWMGRQLLSDLTLGDNYPNGARLYTLTLATIIVQNVGQLVEAYLRVLKWSGLFVAISLGRLLLNVSLNVWLLVGMDMGVEGLLLGNFTASAIHAAALMIVFLKTRGAFRFDLALSIEMLRFSMPLLVTAIMAMLMHEADRYFIRVFINMDEVGVYSLAHKIAFAVNTLCLLPFASIWQVAIYDINRMPKADDLYAGVFRWFLGGLGILLLGAALTVHPVLPLMTPDAYGDATDLISVILLGFFLFGLQLQFEVPAMLSKKTKRLVPGSVIGVVVNVVGNFLLVPAYGSWGAAWVGVLTYASFSFTTLLMCRSIRPIPYPWKSSILVSAGFCGSYVALRYGLFPSVGFWTELLASVGCCAAWAVALFGRDGMEWWSTRQIPVPSYEVAASDAETTRMHQSSAGTVSSGARVANEVMAPETVSA